MNWFTQIINALSRSKHTYLLNNINKSSISLALPNILSASKNLSFVEDKNRALNSSYNQNYYNINHLDSLGPASYILLGLPALLYRLFAAARLSGFLYFSTNINKIQNYIKLSEECTLCNLEAKESLLHLITEFSCYTNLRNNYNSENEGMLELLCDSSKEGITNFYNFFTSILKTRSFLLNK